MHTKYLTAILGQEDMEEVCGHNTISNLSRNNKSDPITNSHGNSSTLNSILNILNNNTHSNTQYMNNQEDIPSTLNLLILV